MSGLDTTIEKLVPLAEQFGPFLFAVLFLLVITRTAHSYYRESSTRIPPAQPDELKAYRNYFVCSMWFGLAVTTLSIGWWVYVHMQGNHTYQVTINNLQQDEEVSAEYFSRRSIHSIDNGLAPLHDLQFLIVQNQPFNVGETFTFFIYKRPAKVDPGTPGIVPTKVFVKYNGHPFDTFNADFSAASPGLKPVSGQVAAVSEFSPKDILTAKRRYEAALQEPSPQ